mmetsp:Transcript_22583/g.49413  ORF Transcript_22583/g.49413 Transcript_22583/m.49413 type:complete len:215 (-) Transcript_22583:1261-1905(-)
MALTSVSGTAAPFLLPPALPAGQMAPGAAAVQEAPVGTCLAVTRALMSRAVCQQMPPRSPAPVTWAWTRRVLLRGPGMVVVPLDPAGIIMQAVAPPTPQLQSAVCRWRSPCPAAPGNSKQATMTPSMEVVLHWASGHGQLRKAMRAMRVMRPNQTQLLWIGRRQPVAVRPGYHMAAPRTMHLLGMTAQHWGALHRLHSKPLLQQLPPASSSTHV